MVVRGNKVDNFEDDVFGGLGQEWCQVQACAGAHSLDDNGGTVDILDYFICTRTQVRLDSDCELAMGTEWSLGRQTE